MALARLIAILLLACGVVMSGAARSQSRPPAIAITNVSVLPMDGDRVLRNQTVLIQSGEIRALGNSSRISIPADATIVDGSGKYVVPGLVDMHSHVHDPQDFPLLLRNGVTTLLDMGGGSAAFHASVEDVRAGRLQGPHILTALKIDGPGDPGGSAVVPATVAEARAAVRRARREGYDFIKVYSRLAPDMFDAVMREAASLHLSVIGHVVRSVGLEESLRRGQVMIAHAEEYLAIFSDGPPDLSRIPALVRFTRARNVTVTANIAGLAHIAAQWGRPEVTARYIAEGQAQNLRPAILERWRASSYARLAGSYEAEARFSEALVAALHRAGTPILVGTDAPDIPGAAPGFSVHDEIEALRRIGFSAYDSLAAATSTPGRFVSRHRPGAQRFGMIRRGYRADLVLLSGDPRQDLLVLRTPERVMARGRWIDVSSPLAPTP